MLRTRNSSRGRRWRLAVLTISVVVVQTVAGMPAAEAVVSGIPDDTWGAGPVGSARVSTIVRSATRIYVGGAFTQAVAPNGSTVPKVGLMALDAATGRLDTNFSPPINSTGKVRSLALSADGSRLFVGGQFTMGSRKNLVALDPATGAVVGGWQADTDGIVWSLAAGNGRVYAGGRFTRVTDAGGPRTVSMLAAVNQADGDVDTGWNATATGVPVTGKPLQVATVRLSADGNRLFVGGDFPSLNNSSRRNFGAVSAFTGAMDTGFAPPAPPSVFAIDTDGARVYISVGGAGGEAQGFDAQTGNLLWRVHGNGNFQAIAVKGDMVYVGGHFGGATSGGVSGAAFGGVLRYKLAAVNAFTGAVHSFAPRVNSALGVYVINVSPNGIDIGGEFTKISPTINPLRYYTQPHYAHLPEA